MSVQFSYQLVFEVQPESLTRDTVRHFSFRTIQSMIVPLSFLSDIAAAALVTDPAMSADTLSRCLAVHAVRCHIVRLSPPDLSACVSARYPNLNRSSVSPYQVRDLVDTDCPESLQRELTEAAADGDRAAERPAKKARKDPLQPDMLLKWCQKQLALTEIQVTDLTLSFKSGTSGGLGETQGGGHWLYEGLLKINDDICMNGLCSHFLTLAPLGGGAQRAPPLWFFANSS